MRYSGLLLNSPSILLEAGIFYPSNRPVPATDLIRSLRQAILLARQNVYAVGSATPLATIRMEDPAFSLFVKREDLSPIHAYKWRGACNRMARLSSEALERGVVTASAGNHAQGVALAAANLGTHARIFMPQSTPRMKQRAVRALGGSRVSIELIGDSYDVASAAAHDSAAREGRTFIHAYDDLEVMGGQGTLADEIVLSGEGPFDLAFIQVGGGGIAAACATWLKLHYPEIRIVGVEGERQASMAAAVRQGGPVTLDTVDVFCDGTAVRKAGALTYPICASLVDEWMTVSNDEVSAAIQFLWERLRCIPEPSGAMGVAAALRQREHLAGKRVLSILCGANMDFEQLATIARRSAVGAARRRFLRIGIPERRGAMLELLRALPEAVNIVDFQYGKTDAAIAYPVIGFEVAALEFDALVEALRRGGFDFLEVTDDPDVAFRMIHYEAARLGHPLFITLDFYERPGALAGFLEAVSPHGNLCYFNYAYSGERVGRALLGFEFESREAHQQFEATLERARERYRGYSRIERPVMERILGS